MMLIKSEESSVNLNKQSKISMKFSISASPISWSNPLIELLLMFEKFNYVKIIEE